MRKEIHMRNGITSTSTAISIPPVEHNPASWYNSYTTMRFAFDAQKSKRLRSNPKRGIGFAEAHGSVNLIWPPLIILFGPPPSESALAVRSEGSPAAPVGRRV